jgi:ISXO2-like transposase domain
MWYITSQKNGVSALGLQRVLGLGSYRTASLMLHKVRQARAGENWGSAEFGGATCRKTLSKVLIIVAAEADGKRIGRIRMALIEDFDRKTLHRFIQDNIELGSTVCTDGLNSTGNSMAISTIEKFKTLGREASLCFRAFTWSFPC